MSQQVNLLNPAFRKRRDWLSATTLAGVVLASCLVVVVAHFLARQRADDLAPALAQGEARILADRARLAAAGKAAATPTGREAARIDGLRATVQSREMALAELRSGALGDTDGFAGLFRAFARQAMPGVWLTGFQLAGAGEMRVEGRALAAEQVPAYIRRLNAEPAFKGRAFESLSIEEGRVPLAEGSGAAKGNPAILVPAPWVEFRLQSKLVAAEGEPRGPAKARSLR